MVVESSTSFKITKWSQTSKHQRKFATIENIEGGSEGWDRSEKIFTGVRHICLETK